jgi:hypothetical protein
LALGKAPEKKRSAKPPTLGKEADSGSGSWKYWLVCCMELGWLVSWVSMLSSLSRHMHARGTLSLAGRIRFLGTGSAAACSFGLIWLAKNTVGWFFMREKHCWFFGCEKQFI